MNDKEFELFSAAVIIGGFPFSFYKFGWHCGGPRDKGTDVILKDQYRRYICVQAKRYIRPVSSDKVLNFIGSLRLYQAHSGYIVTTSRLTSEGKRHVSDEKFLADHGRGGKVIEVIDQERLDELLRTRAVEIDQAWRDVLARHAAGG